MPSCRNSPGRGKTTIKLSFHKQERLCSKKQMEALFKNGGSAGAYPLKLVFMEIQEPQPFPARVMFVAPKRNFKHAWERNSLKRKMREVYRLNKAKMYGQLQSRDKKMVMAFIYTSKKKEQYKDIERSMLKLMSGLGK